MKKIPTMFKRNPENMSEILDEPHDDCLWVFRGEGVATRKYDGTCCLIDKWMGPWKFFKRREIKKGKPVPPNFVETDFDKVTGKKFGWVPVDPKSKEDRWHMEAYGEGCYDDGTYELIGPKIQGNPERYPMHCLVSHQKAEVFDSAPRTYEGLKEWFKNMDIEGIVFHHPDGGGMCKIKKRDFGLRR